MERSCFNPSPLGGMSASQWLVRKIELDGFKPNEQFCACIRSHPVEVWLTDGKISIATPCQGEAGSDQLDQIESRIRTWELKVKAAIETTALLELVAQAQPDAKEGELPF